MEKTRFFTVIENQVADNGAKGLLYNHFDEENQAYARYYTICAAAAISEIPYHSAAIIRDDGIMIEEKVFDRRVNVEPEPEPEPEPEEE